MTYELAKELKDAGFPQDPDYLPGDYIPNLSELIEACGEKLMSIHRTAPPRMGSGEIFKGSKWCAETYFEMDDDEETPLGSRFGLGDTPEEAVARLYLALHPSDATVK